MKHYLYKGNIITASSKEEAIKVLAKKVTVRCYKKLKYFKNREEAINFFNKAISNCDYRSHECERYKYILKQLEAGKFFIDDENMNY